VALTPNRPHSHTLQPLALAGGLLVGAAGSGMHALASTTVAIAFFVWLLLSGTLAVLWLLAIVKVRQHTVGDSVAKRQPSY
jgi:hypothetical protein